MLPEETLEETNDVESNTDTRANDLKHFYIRNLEESINKG